ncbi:transposase [Streptomyces europaeiscabiei]|uniref:transposase n=1 Tax=Streptomyces europaeiscabiei TaxID=146819 RepID=UPI002E185C3E
MAEKRQSYDAEFREGAVRIVTGTGKTIAQVAADLGIKETTLGSWAAGQLGSWAAGQLGSWVARARRAGGDGTMGELEREELVRLRRESVENRKRIKEVAIERDVFKRAMALWVK